MKFIVKSGNWEDTYEFSLEKIMRRAVLSSIKRRKAKVNTKVGVIVLCEPKFVEKGENTYVFNTYYVLKSLGMRKKAEELRQAFKLKFGIDVKNENKSNNT